jgi:hypothetical protein
MKKFLAISVAIMYLGITSGLVLQIHYCMGKAAGTTVQFTEKDSHLCDKCGMQKGATKCCHDEIKVIKVQDSHKQVTNDFQCQPPAAPEQEYNLINPAHHFYSDATPVSNHSPPTAGPTPLCIFNCVFRL